MLRAPHSNQSVEKPRNLCGRLVNFKAELFCSSHLDQHCAPRLVVLGRQWRCLLEEANTDLAPVMRALQRKCHILSRGGGVHHPSCQLLPFRIGGAPCRRRQRYERAKTYPFLRSTKANFGWRDFRTLSFGAGHKFHSVSRLQHSGKIGVLVSMVLFHTLFFCDLTFLGLQCNSEQGAQRRGRVSVSLYALTAVHMPGTRMLGSSWMQHVLLCRSLVSRWFSPSTF